MLKGFPDCLQADSCLHLNKNLLSTNPAFKQASPGSVQDRVTAVVDSESVRISFSAGECKRLACSSTVQIATVSGINVQFHCFSSRRSAISMMIMTCVRVWVCVKAV